MVYVQQVPSIECIEFDDEREIMSKIFDGYELESSIDGSDYLNPSLTHNHRMLNIMPEVCRVARVLLIQNP